MNNEKLKIYINVIREWFLAVHRLQITVHGSYKPWTLNQELWTNISGGNNDRSKELI